ncbi:alpha/beta fold hydrolase [Mucilaginibacter antarcticus]|uniref:alpha/beta fold hydrolase n=1 Tax=Mucilaginibacter antarcticus TaxID=1855725 RepID=UPI00362BE985
MAKDVHDLLNQLGYHSYFIAGHDFGGPIAYALSAAYPESVRKLAVFESLLLLPTEKVALPAWFVPFFQTPEIPEMLLKGREREFLKTWMNQLTINKSAISGEDLDEYARTYALPGAVEAGAELYRAFPKDLEDNTASSKDKLTIPVLAYGAESVMKDNTLLSFQAVANNVRGGVVPDCGHFVPEEQPEFVVKQLLAFLGVTYK